MTERERRHLRGRVHTVRTDFASWESAAEEWTAPERSELLVFLSDGRLSRSEFHSPSYVYTLEYRYDDGGRLIEVAEGSADTPKSSTQFRYDRSGRLVESVAVDRNGARQQLATCAYDVNGRKSCVHVAGAGSLPADEVHDERQGWHAFSFHSGEADSTPSTVTVLFDTADRPMEVLTHTATHELRSRAIFTRDREGRMLTGELMYGSPETLLGPAAAETLAQASPEERLDLERTLELVMERQTFLTRTFAYDSAGRLIEMVERMGQLAEEVTTFQYDERGFEIERRESRRTRELDETGTFSPEQRREHATRSDYRHDSHGNWTERVWKTSASGTEAGDSGIERRVITYYGG